MPRRGTGVSKLMRGGKWTGKWQARYYDAAGQQHTATFDREGDGITWRNQQLAAVQAGTWVDPRGGAITVREYAEKWRAAAGHRGQSAATVESRLRVHLYPALGDRPLRDLRHSEVKAWVTGLERTLAPWTAYGVHAVARSVLNAAVADRLLPESPFARIPLRGVTRRDKVVPMTVAEVRAVVEASTQPYRALFALGAATGLRGGELRGLCLAELDMLRRTVRVERQLVEVQVDGHKVRAFGPPKTEKSRRTLDVPQWALDEVAALLAVRPAVEVTLPVIDTPRVREHTGHLVFTTSTGRPILRSGLIAAWHNAVKRAEHRALEEQHRDRLDAARRQSKAAYDKEWAKILTAAEAARPGPRRGGPHHLRHHVASLLIDGGESVKVVQEQLGHATAAETWDTYSHLFPDKDGRVRGLLQQAWQADEEQTRNSDPVADGQ